MASPARTISPAKVLTLPCSQCGVWELHRKPRNLFQKLSAVDPYACARCGKHEIRLTLGTGIGIFLCVALLGVVVYFSYAATSLLRGQDASHNTSETLALARNSAGALSPFEQMMIKKPRTSLDNSVILKLWKAQVGPDIILQLIRTSNADYDVSANSIIELKQAGVEQSVILAMIDASYNAR